MQATLISDVTFHGVGLHSGVATKMTVRPAGIGHGVWFKRVDVAEDGSGRDPHVPASYDAVEMKPLCTRIVNADGVEVQTIEHITAALAGCGVRNALIELDGPEVPIMDGASGDFVRAFVEAGVKAQDAAMYAIEILDPVTVEQDGAVATLSPARSLEIDFRIEFDDAAIGAQSKTLNMANGTFVRELSDSRTFCRKSDIDTMHANGLALGGTYENAVVVDGDDVLSPGGLRHADEAVRHKMLDALGDLSLAGAPILGRYTGVRAGHALTNKLLHKLFATPGSYRLVPCTPAQLSRLPGVGVKRADLALVS
ncbi:UDP-3-O-acyl-N-acetylglucosamine deacetylase [uncultured Litoreibacter sp.]|uniref:UDP-3-O-acyl-N-acetylglucosamine deacetylase n=1 Tax=uncultured Litoreibacter sp. TaxID=1392394 RepID=UPI0026019EEB|nr:UDP-3-O-acyl-N-acetylglucosamine deacetylase [uncultured Litoreibacter sp.]